MDILPSYIAGFFAVLLLSSFVKILTTLNILRYGIGLKGGAFGLVLAGCSLALSLLVMSPCIDKAGGLDGMISGNSPAKLEENFRPFLAKHVHQDVLKKFSQLSDKLKNQPKSPADAAVSPASITVLVPAFLISELKEAFQIGFLLLVPFLIIDLVVVNGLMVLGITQMSPAAVAFPMKILLFFAIDGWTLLSEKLVMGYL